MKENRALAIAITMKKISTQFHLPITIQAL